MAFMNEHAAMNDYATRLERVFQWLAGHLDDTIDLSRLADVACLSPYHFHRVYRFIRGETVTETVRRLRLHRAAVELINGEIPVSRIGARAGYASQEAFTRAFSSAYGVPPARYRASFVPLPTTHNPEETMESTMTHNVAIREIPEIRVAALPHRGDYAQIGTTFEQLSAIAGAMNLFGPWTRSFGIYYDDPTATPRNTLRSDACLTVPEGWSPSGRLESREIRGGRYAVILHVGPYAELEHTYKWAYGTWLAQSGEELGDAPLVEEYLNDVRTVPPTELKTEIWLPLR
jgi:AraC family transcriptional regulator